LAQVEPHKKYQEAPHDGENVTHYLGNDDDAEASLPEGRVSFRKRKKEGKSWAYIALTS